MPSGRIVTIVGIGALGSHLVQFLRSQDGIVMRLIDDDRVETRNTASQFHDKPHVGRLKVEALKAMVRLLWGWGIKLETIPHRLTESSAIAMLSGSALVVDCLDNGKSRRVLQDTVRRKGIPCLHGALDGAGSFGQVVWDAHFQIDDEPHDGAATCEDGRHLPFIAITAAYLASAVVRFLGDGGMSGYMVTPAGTIMTHQEKP